MIDQQAVNQSVNEGNSPVIEQMSIVKPTQNTSKSSKTIFTVLILLVSALVLIVLGTNYYLNNSKTQTAPSAVSHPAVSTPITAQTGYSGPAHMVKGLGSVSEKYIDASISYLKNKLGDDYYNKFLSPTLQRSGAYSDCDNAQNCTARYVTVFDQHIPYAVYYSASGPVMLDKVQEVSVSLADSGKLLSYSGPVKAYTFAITKNDILKKAQELGVSPVKQAGITAGKESTDGYEIVWKVEDDKNGVMLDPDTGVLIQRYSVYHCTGQCPL